MDNIYEKLNEIFRDFFDDDELVVNSSTVASDVPGWDSLEHITLLAVIEDEFNVTFDVKKAASYGNVGELAKEIAKQTGEIK